MWMKVDDRMHSHRKTRRVIRSSASKSRDIAPMGLWALAGSWASQNGTDGWVPELELDRWDDDWEELADRLVKAGYWAREDCDGEPGYSFVDWEDYNPVRDASKRGAFGNHVRWHVNEGIVSPDCDHCPQEPVDETSVPPESHSDIAPESHSDRQRIAGRQISDSLTDRSTPTRPQPDPDPKDSCASADAEREREQEFADWWAMYPRKKGKGQAVKAYRAARKKVSAERIAEALEQQLDTLTKDGVSYCPYPATWLNGERWDDEPDTNVSQIRPKRPRRNGLAFVPTCPTCAAPPEDVHDPECPNQDWRPNTEGIGL